MANKNKRLVAKYQKGGSLQTFLEPSNISVGSLNLDDSTRAEVERKTAEGMMLDDAVKGVAPEFALSTSPLKNIDGTVPEERVHMLVDVNKMARDIDENPEQNFTYDERVKYKRTLQVIDAIQKNNFTITKSKSGRYWLESNEDGKRHYASNSINEVAELLDRYASSGAKVVYNDPNKSKTIVKEEPKIITEVNNEKEETGTITPQELATGKEGYVPIGEWGVNTDTPTEFTTSDYLNIGSFATDALTSAAGMTTKASVVGAPVGAAINIGGGLIATGMGALADYLDPEVTNKQLLKGVGLRLGLEAAETVAIAPLSLGKSFLKVAPLVGKALKGFGVGNAFYTALSEDWSTLTDKNIADWDVDDYRKAAFIAEVAIMGGGAIPARRRARYDLLSKSKKTAQTDAELAKDPGVKKLIEKKVKPQTAKIDQKAAKLKDTTSKNAAEKVRKQKEKTDKELAKIQKDYDVNKAAIDKKYNEAPVVVNKQGQIEIDFEGNKKPAIDPGKRQAEIDALDKIKAKADAKIIKAGEDVNKAINKAATDRAVSIEKAATSSTKKLVEKTTKEVTASQRKAYNDEFDNAEGLAKRFFGSNIGGRMSRKAQEKAFGTETIKKRREAAEKIKKAEKEAETKLGKAREAVNKKKAEIAKNDPKADKAAQQRDLQLLEDKAKALETKRNKLVQKTFRATQTLAARGRSRVGDFLGTYVKDAPMSLFGSFSQGMGGTSPVVNQIMRGAVGEDVTGHRYYEYTRDQAETRLTRLFGYSKAELEKYSTEQLRMILKKAEGAKYGNDFEGGRKADYVNFLERDFVYKRNGGTMEQKRLIPKASKGYKIIGGAYIPDEDPAENPSTNTGKTIKTKEDVVNNLPASTVAELTNMGILGDLINHVMENDALGKEMTADQLNKKVESLKHAVLTGSYRPQEFKNNNYQKLFKHFKPSDFIPAKVHVERYPVKKLIAPSASTPIVRNMAGYGSMLNRLQQRRRIDTGDSMRADVIRRQENDDAMNRTLALVAKNDEYRRQAEKEREAILRMNASQEANVYNQNIAAENAATAQFVNQKVKAEAAAEARNRARMGRMANALTRGTQDFFKAEKADKVTGEYNRLASLKGIWDAEYAPRAERALSFTDADDRVAELKNKFIEKYEYHPDNFNTDLMSLRTSHKGIF